MAKDVELDEPLIDFFKQANINAIHRVMERANKAADRKHSRALAAGKASVRPGLLAKAMNKAMSAYGRASKLQQSIRQTAPDTGGRPYHFGYSTVTRNQKAPRSSKASGGAGPAGSTAPPGKPATASGAAAQPGRSSKALAMTREAAHQRYAERDAALAKDAKEINHDNSLDAHPGLEP